MLSRAIPFVFLLISGGAYAQPFQAGDQYGGNASSNPMSVMPALGVHSARLGPSTGGAAIVRGANTLGPTAQPVVIDQRNVNNLVEVVQAGTAPLARVTQTGSSNGAIVIQLGTDSNRAAVLQRGQVNAAQIGQLGTANKAILRQLGTNSLGAVLQIGQLNSALASQGPTGLVVDHLNIPTPR